MNAFHDVCFPTALSFGVTGGPERSVEIVRLTNGEERRNARFANSRRSYDAGTAIRSLADLQELVEFFEARRGSLCSFRFRDPFDMKSCRASDDPSMLDQMLGTGDGVKAVFALVKRYGEGEDAYLRQITKPVPGSVSVAVNGEARSETSDFTVDPVAGEVTFLPGSVPELGQVVTAGFLFDVPVRFDVAQLSVSLTAFRAGQVPAVPLVEVIS